jgi:N-acetylglucosamine-6-sulfatase
MRKRHPNLAPLSLGVAAFCLTAGSLFSPPATLAQDAPRNIVFILSDDHRFDFMGFHEDAPDFLETPSLDRIATEGMHIENAFVTTSLCSPSRASILTGQYSKKHGVVDNSRRIREGARFFSEELQEAGYRTAFIGKWHMGGESDEPRAGFDHWVSFRGQGPYFNPTLNIDGERRKIEGYTADILTDFAVDWLGQRKEEEAPFLLYLSHKSVHAEFEPAPRHRDRYKDVELAYPATMARTEDNLRDMPRWVRDQRYGWHGVDHMYHGQMDFDTFYRRYAETLLGLDESVGQVLDALQENGLAESTLVVYMGDNGFSFGEHGLIDKRHAYEESIRVPMLAWSPGFIEPGSRTDLMVLNVDIAPTLLDLAGIETPERMDGTSFLPILRGETLDWREEFVYQYYWEYNFPHTPTVYALRGPRYKYMFFHGIWDRNEFYDLEADPQEQHNLVDSPAHQELKNQMKERLFDLLEERDAVNVQFQRPRWRQLDERLLEN